MSTSAMTGTGFRLGKGWSAEVFEAARAENAGPSEKIRRIVTKVERYHSCPYLI